MRILTQSHLNSLAKRMQALYKRYGERSPLLWFLRGDYEQLYTLFGPLADSDNITSYSPEHIEKYNECIKTITWLEKR